MYFQRVAIGACQLDDLTNADLDRIGVDRFQGHTRIYTHLHPITGINLILGLFLDRDPIQDSEIVPETLLPSADDLTSGAKIDELSPWPSGSI